MPKQKTTISISSHSLSVIRTTHSPVSLWCAECAASVPMVTPERAAALCATSPRNIYRRVEAGELHFVETGAGELFICCRSLQPS
jgi:hypothetical protein